MKITEENIYSELTKKKINFAKHTHEPLYTVSDSKNKRGEIEGLHTKNLFFKNKKNNFFLFSCDEKKLVDIKKISKSLSLGTLSFAKPEYLMEYLGVKPGSVSPFGLLNDEDNKVSFYLDSDLNKGDKINFHPLINTSTITLNTQEFIKFMIEKNKKVNIFNFSNYTLIK